MTTTHRVLHSEIGLSPTGAHRICRVIYDRETGEYIVRVSDDGHRMMHIDYYTGDRGDAIGTAVEMCNPVVRVRETMSRYIIDADFDQMGA